MACADVDKAIIKLGSDWSLWLHLHVITTSSKVNLESDWSAKLNSLYSYSKYSDVAFLW